MKKAARITAILLVIAMAMGIFGTMTVMAGDYDDYYDTELKPNMDKVGDKLKVILTSKKAMRSAFQSAKTGIKTLTTNTNKVPVLKNDKNIKKYLKKIKSNINNGQKRSKKANIKDKKLMTYQQRVLKYLKLYMERTKKLINYTGQY